MTRYTATILHHSIANARVVEVGDDLARAKRAATREFGAGYLDHMIVIMDRDAPAGFSDVVAYRTIRDDRWTNGE